MIVSRRLWTYGVCRVLSRQMEAVAKKVRSDFRALPEWVMPLVTVGVFAVDALIAATAFVGAFWLREGKAILNGSSWSDEFAPYGSVLIFAVVVTLLMLVYVRVYRFFGAFSFMQEAVKISNAVIFASLLTIAWAFMFRGLFAFQEFSYSRGVFLLNFGFALVGLILFHWTLRFFQVRFRNSGVNLIPTIVVGTNTEAEQTVNELEQEKHLGYRVFGVVSSGENVGGEFAVPVLGNINELDSIIREHGIREVIITDNSIESSTLFDAMMQLGRKQKVEFRFAPNILDLLPQKTSVEQIGVLPMVRLFREPLSDAQRFLKRTSDIVIAIVAVVITLPIWLIAAIAIKLDSRGNILFKQQRVGMDGRNFLCYKFRTMYADADEALHREAYQKNIDGGSDANAGDNEKPVFGKVKDDPRITRFGKLLRQTSLDELPQLLNVVRGEMSIVGPRPPIPYEVEQYELWHRKRLDMKPGITGLWQVSGRNRLTFDEMVRADIYYIENWSLLLDAKIILLTLPAMFRGDGAR